MATQLAGWGKRVKATLDHDDIDSALSWFPVRLHLHPHWTSPTGFVDPDTGWAQEAYIHDDNTSSAGFSDEVAPGNFCPNIELTHAEITCSGVRYYIHSDATYPKEVSTDIYYGAAWHEVEASQTPNHLAWTEVTFPSQAITSIRFRIKNVGEVNARGWLYEVDFLPAINCNCVFDEVGANSKKIAIVPVSADQIDANQLYGEIENWDHVAEEANIWTSKDGWTVTHDVDEEVWLYYDNTHADNDTYIGVKNSIPAQSVWNGNFKAVYHMADGVDNAHIYDSTDNNNDGVKKGANEPNEVAGYIANEQDFDGADDKITVADHATLDFTSALSIMVCIKIDAFDVVGVHDMFPIVNKDTLGTVGYSFCVYNEGAVDNPRLAFYDGTGWRFGNTTIAVGTRYVVGVDYDGTNTKFYLNGVPDGAPASAAAILSANALDLIIGYRLYSGATEWYANGRIDELRLAATNNGPAWFKASYESERDHLITWGSEEILQVWASHHQINPFGINMYRAGRAN